MNLNSYYTSSGGNTYDWYSSASATLASRIADPTTVSTAGKYYVFATSAQGCTGSPDSVQIVVNPVITDSISSPSVSCNNGALALDVFTSGNTYSWQLSTDGGATFSNVPASSPYIGM